MSFSSILILEDTEETLNWLLEVTQSVMPEADIKTATCLKDAMSLISIENFQLAIVDLGLPDGSGIDLIEAARRQSSSMQIIVATIYDDDRHLFDALRAGANGYVLKDDDKEKIGQYLQGLNENKTAISTKSLDRVLNHFHAQGESRREISLTAREEDILRLIAKGYNVGDTAKLLTLSAHTVKGYIKTIYTKLDVSSRAEATAEAIKRNLIEL